MDDANRPRVVPHKNFNAIHDARLLEKAIRGKGCDEEAMINILCNRTWRQRQEITDSYEHQYHQSLTSLLKLETSGDLRDLMVTLMQSPALNDVIMLKDALKSKDHVILNTIAFTKNPEEMHEIQRVYAEKYGSNLIEDVDKATKGYYEQLLLLSWRGQRDPEDDKTWNSYDAERHARELWDAVQSRASDGTDMTSTHTYYYSLYTTTFGSRSFPHLRQVFQAYEQLTKSTIERNIKDMKMKKDDEKGFLSLIRLITNASGFFVDQLVDATKGPGTNEKKLDYLTVSRAEIDLGNIADEYQRLHKQPLDKLIEFSDWQSKTSVDYRQALLTLVRGNATNADRN